MPALSSLGPLSTKMPINVSCRVEEKIIKGATSKDIFFKILKKNKNTTYLKNIGDLNKLIKPHTMNKNTIIFMGAGSISSIAKKYLNN